MSAQMLQVAKGPSSQALDQGPGLDGGLSQARSPDVNVGVDAGEVRASSGQFPGGARAETQPTVIVELYPYEQVTDVIAKLTPTTTTMQTAAEEAGRDRAIDSGPDTPNYLIVNYRGAAKTSTQEHVRAEAAA